jgi:Calcineurin-like phosphoesterase
MAVVLPPLAASGLSSVSTLAPADAKVDAPDATPLARYVSTSGVPHIDVANVRVLRRGVGWDPGDPNGINADWRAAIDTVWNQIASENPRAVFATGDMVQGYWGVDDDNTGIFGPVDTFLHRKAAVVAAGDAYEGTLRRTYAHHGLVVYPGMGDHEMGGLDHDGESPPSTFRARALSSWVSTWSRNFNSSPYYHVTLAGGVELWTLKPFRRDPDGGVSSTIGRGQRRWLQQSLAASNARWKIVQSEIPPYSSIGFTGQHTSATHLLNADQVYSILARNNVDLMLCAEFHDVDALQVSGVPEIIHGGAQANPNYLVLDVYADHLQVTSKQMSGTTDRTTLLWQPSDANRPAAAVQIAPGAVEAGHLTITHDGATAADGDLVLR